MIRRQPIVLFSLSFLDCICCGFGAIILLFVLTMGSQTEAMREMHQRMQRILAKQLITLAQFRQDKDEQLRKRTQAIQAIEAQKEQDTIQALLAQLEQQLHYERAGRQKMLVQIAELKKDIAARQKKPDMLLNENIVPTPIGLPANSNYVCFVIDSSGSMRDPTTESLWAIVLRKFDEVMDAYPQVEGVQFLDADGRFILGGRTDDKWLPDSPEVRDAIKRALARYPVFSNSNPVPGIVRAFRTLHEGDNAEMKMTIFILGDEFTGTADAVLRRLDELNPRDKDGKRKVVINAIGFPTAIKMGFNMGNTGVKYANLMRELTYQHGGAFIALQDIEIP